MAKKRRTSKTKDPISEVRGWRKEAFDEVVRMTPAQRSDEEARIAKKLGLRIADGGKSLRGGERRRKAV